MKLYLKRIFNKFKYAFSGLWHGIAHDKSIQFQCFFGCVVLLLGLFFSFTIWEWCCLLFAIGLVIAFEFINSAIEHCMDIVSPEYHPIVKIIKDYAAAAVLIMSIIAAIVGILIFGGNLF